MCCLILQEEGSNLGRLEKELKSKEKAEAELVAQIKANKDSLASEKNKKKQLEKSLKEVSTNLVPLLTFDLILCLLPKIHEQKLF